MDVETRSYILGQGLMLEGQRKCLDSHSIPADFFGISFLRHPDVVRASGVLGVQYGLFHGGGGFIVLVKGETIDAYRQQSENLCVAQISGMHYTCFSPSENASPDNIALLMWSCLPRGPHVTGGSRNRMPTGNPLRVKMARFFDVDGMVFTFDAMESLQR